MPERFMRGVEAVNGIVWGPVGLGLLFGTGLLRTVRTGGFQLRRWGYWMRHTEHRPSALSGAMGLPHCLHRVLVHLCSTTGPRVVS